MSKRIFIEFAVVMVLGIVLVRAFIMEAYVVPTGSMAPALAGRHKVTDCPACGFSVMVGHYGRGAWIESPEEQQEAERHYHRACCPNCGCSDLKFDDVERCDGDRLLVHKHVFALRPPRRWEMVVFRPPHPQRGEPVDAYIKRAVGLPGESVQIHDGDIYANGRVARKSLAELKAMRLLVFDNDFVPSDAPIPFRWNWAANSPWQSEAGGKRLRLAQRRTGTESYDWLWYRHLVRSGCESGGWHEDTLKDATGYNGTPTGDSTVHDLMLECEVKAAGRGSLALSITDGFSDVLVEIPVGLGSAAVRVRHARRNTDSLAPARTVASSVGSDFEWREDTLVPVEVALVDRRLTVTAAGRDVCQIDLPEVEPGAKRYLLHGPLAFGGRGPIAIGGKGINVEVRHLRLYRDVHYTEGDANGPYRHATLAPVRLGTDEYLVLGDNTTSSYDSRRWEHGPVVHRDDLVGKPFLLHLPTRLAQWRLLPVQRALAVPDWSRIKILR